MTAESSKRVLLAGATGYIGRAVAAELARRGVQVVAISRTAEEMPGCEVRVASLTNAEELARAIAGLEFDAVVSCIASRSGVSEDAWLVDYRANRNLLAAALESNASRFMLLSAICVQRPRLAFQHAKLAFEKELRDAPIEHTIIRPTAFFKSLSGQIERIRQGKPYLIFGDGTETACKPIGEADLAAYLADRIDDEAAGNQILPIGGPGDAVTPLQQGHLLFELTGLPPKFRSVSPAVIRAIGGLLSPVGRLLPGAARKAELARIGHYYATESMLVWDEKRQRYDADLTPSTGRETLRDYYQRVLAEGLGGQELGDHKVF